MKISAKLNINGFTLFETIIVISIIGIIAAIGLPAYQQIGPNLNLSSATKDISSDLRYTQQLSVTEQTIYSLVFDNSQGYRIFSSSTGETIRSKTLHQDIIMKDTTGLFNDTVNFTATGAATENGSIILENTKGKTTTIEIKPSGYVTIK